MTAMKPAIFLLLLICSCALRSEAKLPPFDSIARFDLRFAPYAFSTDTVRYKLTMGDIPEPMRNMIAGGEQYARSTPIGYYGLATHEGIIIHRFERESKRGKQTILITTDSTFTAAKLLLRIGQSGMYYKEHDNGRTKLYPDSTQAFFDLQRSNAYWPEKGLLIIVYSSGKYLRAETRWTEYYLVSTNSSIRKLSDFEYYYGHTQKAPIRQYERQHYFSDHESGNPFPLTAGDINNYQFLDESIVKDITIGFRWSVRLHPSLWVVRIQLVSDKYDAARRTDVLMTFDNKFRLIDKKILPISGREAVEYNASRMPDSLLNIHSSEYYVNHYGSDSAECSFVVAGGSLGMMTDPFGQASGLPDGWREFWRIDRTGKFILETSLINEYPAPSPISFPETAPIFIPKK